MAAIARIGDTVSGTCFQPNHGKGNPPQACTGTIEEGSDNTLNVTGISRIGDSVALDCIDTRTGAPTGHKTTIKSGLSTVVINGKNIARVGDSVGDGSDFSGTITNGSENTNAGQ